MVCIYSVCKVAPQRLLYHILAKKKGASNSTPSDLSTWGENTALTPRSRFVPTRQAIVLKKNSDQDKYIKKYIFTPTAVSVKFTVSTVKSTLF